MNGGRGKQTFRQSLNNARDSYDSHLSTSGRVGWRESDGERSPARISNLAVKVIDDWRESSEDQMFEHLSEIVRDVRQAIQRKNLASPQKVRLGTGKKIRVRRNYAGGSSNDSNLVGKLAEEFVFEYLTNSLGENSESLRHHSVLGETPGYDISYLDETGERQAVEVKGTKSAKFTSLELTANEFRAAEELGARYTLQLVTQVLTAPKMHYIVDPFKAVEEGSLDATPTGWLIEKFSVE